MLKSYLARVSFRVALRYRRHNVYDVQTSARIQQTTRNNNDHGVWVPKEGSVRMWVNKVAISVSASNKPEQAGEFGKPDWRVRITKPTTTLRTVAPDASPYRILDKVTRSKRINSRLKERELATLQKRRGFTNLSGQIV